MILGTQGLLLGFSVSLIKNLRTDPNRSSQTILLEFKRKQPRAGNCESQPVPGGEGKGYAIRVSIEVRYMVKTDILGTLKESKEAQSVGESVLRTEKEDKKKYAFLTNSGNWAELQNIMAVVL